MDIGVQLPDLNHAAMDLAGGQFWQGDNNQIQHVEESADLEEV